MTPFKTATFPLIVLTLASSLALTACDDEHFGDQAEEAGDEVQDAAEEAGDAAEDAADEAGDAVEDSAG